METDAKLIDRVWEQARASNDMDSTLWREDECGAWINRLHYGKNDSEFGWKIENVASGGEAELRALNVANGFDRGGGHARCHVTADRTGQSAGERIQNPRNRSV